jgi:hypothetical protein
MNIIGNQHSAKLKTIFTAEVAKDAKENWFYRAGPSFGTHDLWPSMVAKKAEKNISQKPLNQNFFPSRPLR